MMKIFKNTLFPLLGFIVGLALASSAFAQSGSASRTDAIPAIQINNTSSIQGKYIHALYAIGRRLPLEMTRTPQIDILRSANVMRVSGSSVQFPGLTLEKIAFRGSYNMIVFVVADTPGIRWANPEDHVHVDYSILNIIEKPMIDQFLSQQGSSSVYSFGL